MQIAMTLAWEFWARGWRGILMALVGAVFFPGLVYRLFSLESGVSFRGTDVGVFLQFGFYWSVLITLGSGVLVALGNPTRRYTLPVSSLVIVACPMACAMATVFVLYALAAMTLNAMFDASWPILGPGLLAAVLVAWFQAILWSTSNSRGLQLLTCLAVSLAVIYAIGRWAAPQGYAKAGFFPNVNAWHVLLFGLATLACVGVGTIGFANLRHGSGIEVKRIVDWASRLFPKTARSTPFSSPTSAEFWLEWTKRGCILPAGTALIGTGTLLLACYAPPTTGAEFVRGMSAILLAPACLIGLVLGSRSEHGEFGNFNGSRPLTDGQLANAILKSATVGLISSAVIWAAFMAAALWIVGERGETQALLRTIQQIGAVPLLVPLLARIALVAAVVWSAVSLVTSLSLAGRKVAAVAFWVAFGAWIAGLLVRNYLLSRWYFSACIVLCLLGFLATFVASLRLQLISTRTLLLAASIVLTTVAALHFSVLTSEWKYPLPIPVLLLCGCCLIPISLAAAPLAVWANRHR